MSKAEKEKRIAELLADENRNMAADQELEKLQREVAMGEYDGDESKPVVMVGESVAPAGKSKGGRKSKK